MPVILSMIVLLAFIMAASAAQKQRPQCRDAKTGAFVSAAYAKKYPGLTVCETKTDVVKKKQG